MNKHIELLEQLLIWYWNRTALSDNWEHLSLNKRQEYWLDFFIYGYLKD